MHRFFCANTHLSSPTVELEDSRELHHLKKVLRLKVGDKICLFNGKNEEAVGTILSFTQKTATIKINQLFTGNNKKGPRIILACAIPKKTKFETIVEKCTELDVDEIIPLITQRTAVSLSHDQAQRKASRYETIAVNAAKQSNRKTIPLIYPVTQFKKFIKEVSPDDTKLIPCLTGKKKGIKHVLHGLKSPKRILFIIGPEGDFTPQEVESAIKNGCIPVSLGPTILKVETAAIVVIAAIHLHFTT